VLELIPMQLQNRVKDGFFLIYSRHSEVQYGNLAINMTISRMQEFGNPIDLAKSSNASNSPNTNDAMPFSIYDGILILFERT